MRRTFVLALAFALAAACAAGPNPALVPTLTMPADGALADNGCTTDEGEAIVWDFNWTDVPGASSYELWVKHRSSAEPEVHEMNLLTSSHRSGRIATADGEFLQGWEWKVRATVGGVAQPWTPTARFAVEPPNTDCQ